MQDKHKQPIKLDHKAISEEPPLNPDDTSPIQISEEPAFDPDDTSPIRVSEDPPFDPDDTSPIQVSQRRTTLDVSKRHWLALFMWSAALLITVISGVIYLLPVSQPISKIDEVLPTQTKILQSQPTSNPTVSPTVVQSGSEVPIDVVAELLMKAPDSSPPSDRFYRQQNPYTIAPARSRASVIAYTVQSGDTLDKISERFGVSTDTIVWANDDIYVNRLLPGDQLTILPENGTLHKTLSEETIQSIAEKYKVSPYAIIDSEYNRLSNAKADTLLPVGFTVVVPGGTSTKKAIYWNPGTTFRPASKPGMTGGSGASSNSDGEVSFGGGPGSCGYQPNNGGGPLRVPVGGYTVMQGFYAGHSGIDLAAPPGNTVFAAANGTVIFAGWSNWGYGYSVVLAHGSLLTLYAHMSRVDVACGQFVNAGSPIGAVGSTGKSSGPHLHFETRPGGEPVNPTQYLAF